MSKKEFEIEFERFIFENQSLIHKVCNMYCHTQTDKEDLFQEIMLKLWKGRASFKGQSKLTTWIYRVSLNTAISQSRRKKLPQIFYPAKIPKAKISHSIENIESNELINALYKSIDKLKPVEKAIILLYLEEKSYTEISQIIGITEKNVSVKLVRIRKKLKAMMKATD